MTERRPLPITEGEQARLAHLVRIARAEVRHLRQTDLRLFAAPFSVDELRQLIEAVDFSERLDAFVARFGRLQDLVGDRFLPAWLRAMQEPLGAVLENLDRAERLQIIESADAWIAARRLRNLLVHEYVDDTAVLHASLLAAHRSVDLVCQAAERLIERTTGLLPQPSA